MAAIAACWQLRPDHPALDVLTHLAEPARPLAFLAAGAMLALRLRGPALSILLAASALTIGMATEHRPAHADDRAELTVYSANLWWENENVDATAASIAAANADVVVLIELGDAQSEALDRLLAGYPNRVTTPRVGWRRGASRNVIASRLPLEKIEDTGDGLAVVSARLRLPDGTNLRVLGAHLTRPWPLRAHYAQPWQAVRLAERVGASAEPTLLVGDFNAAPHGRAVTRVEARTPLRAAAGEGGT
ncbi:MAG TPA: endonuclease/exonuclease/phosphatase family protein, partial [Caulobacteraceae bacterium]